MSHGKEARKEANFHSEVRITELRRSLKPVVIKTYGHGNGFTPEEAGSMVSDIRSFVQKATEAGIKVPRNYRSEVIPDGAPDKRAFYLISEAAGRDLGKILTELDDPEQILSLFAEYLKYYQLAWQSNSQISLDPPPANFCLDEAGQLHYVDVFPPRMKTDDGRTISEVPEPHEETRHFIESRYFGVEQARVIYAQWLRAIHTKNIPPEQLTNLIAEFLGPEAHAMVCLSAEERARILHNPLPTDVDALRVMAGELAAKGQMTTSEMKNIFHLCHIIPGGILPPSTTLRVAADMISYAEGRHQLPTSEVSDRSASSLVLLDLDGVVTEFDGSYTADEETLSQLTEWVSSLEETNSMVAGLTNRTARKTWEVVDQLGLSSGWWAIENGSVFANIETGQLFTNQKWQQYQEELVPRLRQQLFDAGVVGTQEAGFEDAEVTGTFDDSGIIKTVITPLTSDGRPLAREHFPAFVSQVIRPVLAKAGLEEYFTIHVGKAIDIDPVGLNKVDGLVPILLMNGQINPANTLFIADAPRDIEVAQVIKELGGEAASVANGRPEFIQAVQDIGGIVGPEGTDHITSVLAIYKLYLEQILA